MTCRVVPERRIRLRDRRAFYLVGSGGQASNRMGHFDGILEEGTFVFFLGLAEDIEMNVWFLALVPDGRVGYVGRNHKESDTIFEDW